MLGTTINHYQILEKIGQGGMGEVYRAKDTSLDREVAIKVLPEQFTQDPQRLARFEREAKLLASLNHPNIAAIYSFEHADDIHFLVLELVEGQTLAERVAKGPLPVEKALEVCRQIAEGVEAAHEKGVIHRDLKPANVKITPEGQVKILDFGLAKAFEAETPVTDISQSPTLTEEMTRAGVILGTAAYMSPEQAKGKPVDKRTDVFAFGCVLYELLTAKRAFEGETITETLAKILEGEPNWDVLPETLPSIIRFVLSRCFEKDPGRRLQHIDGARILIEEALTGSTTISPIGLVRPTFWRRAIPWSTTLLMAVAAGVGFWILTRPLPQPLTKLTIHSPAEAPLSDEVSSQLAISPDGRKIVYQAQLSSGVQLFLRHLDDVTVTPLAGTQGARNPFFSPDGQSVGFVAAGQLRRVPIMGGAPIALWDMEEIVGEASRGASWFEDTIVFGTIGGGGLYRVSADGGEPESLAVPDPEKGESNYQFPQVLPGGKAVLFSISGGDSWQTAVLSLETGEKKIILEEAKQAGYASTGHIVYELPGTGNLMGVPFDLARLEATGGPVSILEGVRQDRDYTVDYTFSSDGTLVYIPRQTNVQSLVWVDREGTESVITQEEVSFGSPRISPNGKQVALAIAGEDVQNIWIYDFEGESLRRLTFEGGYVETWSPDGKWIIFQSGRELRALYRQLADGSGPIEQLTDPTPTSQMPQSLTPDGSVLTFDQGNDIWVLPMDGNREPRPFITSPHFEGRAKFSPDGKWVAYVSDELGPLHVYVSPYPEPDVRWLVSGEEGGAEAVWSPDGKELFYRSGDQMMVVSVQTQPTFRFSRPEVLFEGSYVTTRFGGGYAYYDIAPDGQRFVMIKEEDTAPAQINVVLNWFEELKRLVPRDR